MKRSAKAYLRFSLKTILVLIAAIAIVLGFFVNKAHRQKVTIDLIRREQGSVAFGVRDQTLCEGTGAPIHTEFKPVYDLEHLWWQRWLGEDYVCQVEYVDFSPSKEFELSRLRALPSVKVLYLDAKNIDLTELAVIDDLQQLECISIYGSSSTTILNYVCKHPNIRILELYGFAEFTDESIAKLQSMKCLEDIAINGDLIDRATEERLSKSLPGCNINVFVSGKLAEP